MPAKIPFAYKEVLEAEYKKKALTLTTYEGYVILLYHCRDNANLLNRHQFDEETLEWVPIMKDIQPPTGGNNGPKKEAPQNQSPPVSKQPSSEFKQGPKSVTSTSTSSQTTDDSKDKPAELAKAEEKVLNKEAKIKETVKEQEERRKVEEAETKRQEEKRRIEAGEKMPA